jgi:phosphate starvation-inducible membrane PsiE
MIRLETLPVRPGYWRTSGEQIAMHCTNRGHGQEGINVKRIEDNIKKFGNWLVDTFQLLGLFVIGGTIVWAAVHEYLQMIDQGRAGLDGILLLFIYLELGAMVGIYFKTSHLPVRFLLYVAITALTRLLAIDVKTMPDQHILVITGAIVLLVMAVATISVVRVKFPEKEPGG